MNWASGALLSRPCKSSAMPDNGAMPEWTLADEMARPSINLPRAALLLARAIAYPQLDISITLRALNEIAEYAHDAVDARLSVEEQGEMLARLLFRELGFRGDVATYADPRNSYLNDVVERRLGIPITLSLLYMDMAARLGLPAYGVNMPGHFIVGLHTRDGDHLIDPFHEGRRLSLNDCAELIQMSIGYAGPLDAAWFEPAPAETILVRMLNNLRAIFVNEQAWDKAVAVIEQLRVVQPDEPEHLRDLGLVYYRQNALPQAAHYLESYMQKAPEADDAAVIREGVRAALQSWAVQN